MPLYVHATTGLAAAARLTLEQAPESDEMHWLDCWYANLVDVDKASNLILFTNARSLYSVLIPQGKEAAAFYCAIAAFNRRLRDILASDGIDGGTNASVAARHLQYVTCGTASRLVLESMNELIFHLRWLMQARAEITVEALADVLNELPLKNLDYLVPCEMFENLLIADALSAPKIWRRRVIPYQ